MARKIVTLSATQIKMAKSSNKDYKLFDGGGLYLLVTASGGKLWRFKYRFNEKEKTYSIGMYPEISLLEARQKREDLRNKIANNIDPMAEKKDIKETIKEKEIKEQYTFFKVAQEWWQNYEKEVSENHHIKLQRALENYVYPFIKKEPIEKITRKDIIKILQDLKNRGILDTAKRVLYILNKIYMYAVTLEYVPHNIISDLDKKVLLGKIESKNYPTFTKISDIRGLLLSIDEYAGDYTTKKALQILPYLFVRSFNIRHCEWSEINFEKKTWTIPGEKMKMKEEFILPLPSQVITLLNEVKLFSGDGKYVFPSFKGKDRPMSDNTLICAIRRMGYTKDEFVPHGFRAMFSTIAYEKANCEDGHNFTSEVIEALLAHREPNKVKSAYNRAKYTESMRSLIQWYANYLDRLKNSN